MTPTFNQLTGARNEETAKFPKVYPHFTEVTIR